MTESYVNPEVIVMIDIESLALTSRAVVTQIGMVAVMASDPETVVGETLIYLPIDPQLTLKRDISGSTLAWHMRLPDVARKEIEQSTGTDFDELPSLLRHLIRKFDHYTDGRPYEVYARGPQFDIANIESLLQDVALQAPWKYDRVRDLRTVMALAGMRLQDIPRDESKYPSHMAAADCHYQLLCLTEALRKIRARS